MNISSSYFSVRMRSSEKKYAYQIRQNIFKSTTSSYINNWKICVSLY